MLFKDKDCIVFFGDSITEAGRVKPLGEGAPVNNPLGNGFAALVYAKLRVFHPELRLRVINQGTSGHRTFDLIERMDNDVLSYRPNWVILMIGTNDAWRQFDSPDHPRFHMTDEEYEKNVEYMIHTFKENQIKVILATPFMIEANREEPLRAKIEDYANICRKLAKKYALPFVDTQKVFDQFVLKVSPHEIARDRIHPNLTGHMLIAEEIYKTIIKA